VLEGHSRYYGVPTNYRALDQFRRNVAWSWHRWLQRRSQRGRSTHVRWKASSSTFRFHFRVFTSHGLTRDSRSVDPRWEPGTGNPYAGFCPGGGGPKGRPYRDYEFLESALACRCGARAE